MAGEIRRQWLTEVGGVPVERLGGVRRSGVTADLSRPPKGVIHTTEGSFESALSVFRNTGTPTVMVGRDRSGKLRVAQFMPVGEMALTLRNPEGGVETNRWARVQIEVVGFSQRAHGWPLGHDRKPMDEQLKNVIGDLVRQLGEAAGIPLRRGGNGVRSVSRWREQAGWFGHAEVPENDHWDPGALDWDDLFRRATPMKKQIRWLLFKREGKRTVQLANSAWVGYPGRKRFGVFYARVLPKVLAAALEGKRPFFRKQTRLVRK